MSSSLCSFECVTVFGWICSQIYAIYCKTKSSSKRPIKLTTRHSTPHTIDLPCEIRILSNCAELSPPDDDASNFTDCGEVKPDGIVVVYMVQVVAVVGSEIVESTVDP